MGRPQVLRLSVPIVLALMLSEVRHSGTKRVIPSLIYLPHFVSWVIHGGIVMQFLSPQGGLVNQTLQAPGFEPIFFPANPRLFRPIVVLSGIEKDAGWGTIIYLAALSGIDRQLCDAARIDGASTRHEIWYVTLPGIATTVVVILLLDIGRFMDIGCEQVYVLYNPTVYETGDLISTYVYRVGIESARFRLTTVIGLVKSLVGLVLISTSNPVTRTFFQGSIR